MRCRLGISSSLIHAGVFPKLRVTLTAIRPRLLPEPKRDRNRVDVELPPPCGLITRAMKLAVMDPANRDGELVAYSVSQRTRLGKREVMRIRWHAAAHKTRLPHHELPVLLIAQPDGFAQRTDHPAARSLLGAGGTFWLVSSARLADMRSCRGQHEPAGQGAHWQGRPVRGPAIADREEPCLKPLFDNFGVYRRQGVLDR